MNSGLVIKSTGSWYTVRTDEGKTVDCKVKGNFRLKGIRSTNPVAVGDHVHFILNQEGTAFINEIDDRKNYIIRKASNLSKQSQILAANVDLALLVVTVNYPETSTTFIDRFLAGAEAYRIPVHILINKWDLYDEVEKQRGEALCELYRSIGYACTPLSALHGEIGKEMGDVLQRNVILLAGNSGVGKSTLLNALIPGANVRTAAISEAHNTGMHTTTFSEMFQAPAGFSIIDTPGIKGFGTFDMERTEVAHYFKEIFRYSADCKFNNCTHTHEPGCAVRKAVEEGRISPSRYTSYLSMLEDKDESKYRPAY